MSRRLSAPAEAAPCGPTCLECGAAREVAQASAQFCSRGCRNAWNNRRLSRGAELYDLYMAHRFDRPTAKLLHVLTLLNRLASIYRDDDRRRRAGRRSWTSPAVVVERHPALTSTVILTRRQP